ncbi:MAG TPA: NADH-quinone oxidoreductase subunit L [Sporichthyaceae bacterium]|jgi:NADH-quinone oxidoreductase subunit L|nr:NADH-quinone oxidoreductase subunit L [Sporichthyaceae bacterium]
MVSASAQQGRQSVIEASGIFSATWLMIAIPLFSAAILLCCGKRTDKWGHLLGCAAVIAPCLIAIGEFLKMRDRETHSRLIQQHLYDWLSTGKMHVEVGFQVDQLSICFVLLITFVGSLIHIYSVGYMAHDPRRRRFFGYLNLFVAAMLLLVLANSYLLLFVGWEGVGLASYLLIGFWQHVPEYATAATKAFIMNRVGDIGLLVAMFLMFDNYGSFGFTEVFGQVSNSGKGVLAALGLMLLLGAVGKSAQFPLQAWLLDAMAGPTPVSALIHAATMVTAGVYLIVRSAPIYNLSYDARLVVAIVGAITLLLGALIGTAKDDIKKALAASTMSQIGYMILAAGLGPAGYAFAIFHLLTHGFFKAGLFLSAGSVMHGMHDNTDMRRYGALSKYMPITYACFGMGYLAIIGVPPFAGFWSKDKIVEAAFNQNVVLGLCALLGAGITAFYMSRVMFMTFFGQKRWDEDVHPHESPLVMTAPITVLAAGAGLGGVLLINNGIVKWLEPVVGHEEKKEFMPVGVSLAVTLAAVAVGLAIAFVMYLQRPVARTAPAGGLVVSAVRRDMYQDAINEVLFMRPGQWTTRFLVWAENRGLDGIVNGLAAVLGGSAGRVRRLQAGFVRSYALTMFGGAAALIIAVLLVRL